MTTTTTMFMVMIMISFDGDYRPSHTCPESRGAKDDVKEKKY